jgi:glyoxylase-like metal-dependent hydrolase (beta-lactamase superfamily II)
MQDTLNGTRLSLQPIARGVHAWIGLNGNSNAGVIETAEGSVVIDAQQTAQLGTQLRMATEAALNRPIMRLVNSHFHLDHTAGNVAFAGVPVLSHERTLSVMTDYLGPAYGGTWSISDLGRKLRLFFGSNFNSLVKPGSEGERWFIDRMTAPDNQTIVLRPPSETFADKFRFETPNDRVMMEYWGPAHSDGDLVIWLKEAKVAFLGDLMFHGRFPWLGDCDLDGWIERLDRFLGLDVEVVVPGHGPVATMKEVAEFRALLVALRSAVAAAVKSGLSEEAAAREVDLIEYRNMPRYREWMPYNVRAVYQYLRSQ